MTKAKTKPDAKQDPPKPKRKPGRPRKTPETKPPAPKPKAKRLKERAKISAGKPKGQAQELTVKELMPRIGRPRKYQEPEEMAEQIDLFFLDCEERNIPPTIQGLTLWLGFSGHDALWKYGQIADFSDLIKRAREACHTYLSVMVLKSKQPTGAIFSLKANYGWQETSAVQVSGSVDHNTMTNEQIENRISYLLDRRQKQIELTGEVIDVTPKE